MLLRTRYSQETVERFKALVREEKRVKRITCFISNNTWIYFKARPLCTLITLRTLLNPLKITRIKGDDHALLTIA
jgi:hypothetical protein